MSAKNRAGLIDKLYKVAKKQYRPIAPPANRSVLEHMLYGCCLENSTNDSADQALAMLQENFCDWNEVRVTTVEELADIGKGLAIPIKAAHSVKRTLFGVFETHFTFDIDFLKKENISKTLAAFEKLKGVSPFVISYVAQNGLGSHAIPVDDSMLQLFFVLGIVSESEHESGRVPGLERAIAKAKGAEFFSVVHQMAVAFATTPFSKTIRDTLLTINSEAKERFPKRASTKKEAEPKAAPKSDSKSEVAAATTATKKVAAKKTTKASAPVKKTAKKSAPKKKTSAPKAAPKKTAAKKKPASATKKVTKVSKKTTKKPAVAKSKTAGKATGKTTNNRLAKRKPR